MRGIIFDLDDTLYPRADFMRSGFDAIARYVSHSWRCDRTAVFVTLLAAHSNGREGREFQAVCEEHRLPHSVVPTLVTVFRDHVPSLALRGDVRRTLAGLRRDGWRLVILTNGAPDVQRRKIASLGLDGFVDAVLYAEEHARGGKPDAAAFRAALSALCVPLHRCVLVGDDPVRDIEGARNVGVQTIRMLAPGQAQRLEREADAVVASIIEIPAFARVLLTETADAA